jgi:hypothetical protein
MMTIGCKPVPPTLNKVNSSSDTGSWLMVHTGLGQGWCGLCCFCLFPASPAHPHNVSLLTLVAGGIPETAYTVGVVNTSTVVTQLAGWSRVGSSSLWGHPVDWCCLTAFEFLPTASTLWAVSAALASIKSASDGVLLDALILQVTH